MCDDCAPPPTGLTRRRLLVAGGAMAIGGATRPSPLAARALSAPSQTVEILPRDMWGSDLPPTGPIDPEPDVRFLLVHHTVTGNDYGTDAVAGIIRGFHSFHTGPDKGWPDVAYNFLVDRFGRIWEARAGSLDGAVRGSATGGNQGFDQKCSFIGDHTSTPPTAEAQAAMVSLLAWLADRHGIATDPGSTTTFTSLGSNRHLAGTEVTTATIEGHRSMSHTACPGDAAYPLVTDTFPAAVTRARAGPTSTLPNTTTSTTSTTVAPPTTGVPSTTRPSTAEPAVAAGGQSGGGGGSDLAPLAIGGGTLAVIGGAIAAIARRRLR